MVKNEEFQCPSESWVPEDFKTHPTFVLSAIFEGVMASQNMGNFFLGHPVYSVRALPGLSEKVPIQINKINELSMTQSSNHKFFWIWQIDIGLGRYLFNWQDTHQKVFRTIHLICFSQAFTRLD